VEGRERKGPKEKGRAGVRRGEVQHGLNPALQLTTYSMHNNAMRHRTDDVVKSAPDATQPDGHVAANLREPNPSGD